MKNTIFLTKDILRKDYLRCYNSESYFNTPNIDKLASEGTIFNRYYCSAPSSGMAVTAMFTGLEPHELDRKKFGEVEQFHQGKTLFNELEDSGVKTFVTWTREFHHLAFVHSKIFDERTVVNYAPRGGSTEVNPQAHAFSKVRKEQSSFEEYDLREYFLNFFRKIRDSVDTPWFIWCHAPHVFSPRENYGSDIDIFDDFVGQIVNEFDIDLIVSADHGHSRAEHGRITYGFHLNEGAINLPLITPNYFSKSKIDSPLGQTQIKNLIMNREVVFKEFIYSDTQYYEQPDRKLMILKDNFKYIYDKFNRSEELYDLSFDKNENINLLIKAFPDPERGNYYNLSEIINYDNWDLAREYYNSFVKEWNKIWRTESLKGKIWNNLKKIRRRGIASNLRVPQRRAIVLNGRWGSKAKLPSF